MMRRLLLFSLLVLVGHAGCSRQEGSGSSAQASQARQ